jgi:Holliday junction resolvase-like predicted endonuclease
MGYETDLEVDGRTLLLWRKYASELPRLLFTFDQVEVRPADTTNLDDTDKTRIRLLFRARAEEVLATLEESGLGWAATVAAYSEIRIDNYAPASLMARMRFKDLASSGILAAESASFAAAIEEFRAGDAEGDLKAFGRFLRHQWDNESLDEVFPFSQISYDQALDRYAGSELFEAQDYAERHLSADESHRVIRAIESWWTLYLDAPLLAWPMLMCIFLAHLNPDTIVVYDLSDHAREHRVEDVEASREFAEEYWASASESLSSTARKMGQLFGVLASFDNQLGREFWFARAASLYAALQLKSDAGSGSKDKGDALERLAEALLRAEEPELQVVERNFRTRDEEVDVLVTNGIADPFWQAYNSPLILIECKNTKSRIGNPELRIFETKMRDRGAHCRIGIFISVGGFAKTFVDRLKSFQASDGVIFIIDGDDLKEILSSKTRLTKWLKGPGLRKSLGAFQ